MDRTSQLPECILHNILSFLEPKDASRSCFLSKSWLGAFSTSPILHFDAFSFGYNQKKREKFLTFVEHRLSTYSHLNLSIQKFRLVIVMLDYTRYASLIDKWIGIAIDNGVEYLHLHTTTLGRQSIYVLPQIVFSAKSLVELSLHRCNFDKKLIREAKIEFNQLKKLEFGYVTLHDWVLYKLVSNCSMIEEIRLFFCELDFKFVSLAELPKLKCLSIEECSTPTPSQRDRLQIESLSLQSIICVRWNHQVVIFEACRNLTKIRLTTRSDGFFPIVTFSNFLFLEDLELKTSSWLKRLDVSGPSLKRVRVCGCFRLEEAKIDAPNLILFEYSGYTPAVILVNTTKKLKAHLHIFSSSPNKVSSTWILKVREFLMNQFNLADVVLSLEIHRKMRCFEIMDFNELPKLEVENLNLILRSSSMNKALVDGLFWSFHPKMLCFKWLGVEPDPQFVKFLWRNIMCRDGDNPDCCNSNHQIKCWRHYLKDAKTESEKGAHGERQTLPGTLQTAGVNKEICFRLN